MDKVFRNLDGASVVTIDLETSHGPVRLAKTDDDWRLVEPLDDPADAAVVKTLIDAIANLDVERTLPAGEVALADHGLDDPVLGLTLVDAQGRRFSLTVGGETPLGSNRAVIRDSGAEIIMVPGVFCRQPRQGRRRVEIARCGRSARTRS